ncbi:ABC transporter substrate-binding protein [Vreelandella titanicae]|uniref:ABC transporter substrate-binding protein n=1 Tax=Vreelandella titanicae TaxID=664683 RepID=UPI00241D77A0|nr:ABC transporter substrate-binding protein [Halomonas titanicae]UEQ05181.1 ABC transporter substrate-binding protein [Halomonas profundus]
MSNFFAIIRHSFSYLIATSLIFSSFISSSLYAASSPTTAITALDLPIAETLIELGVSPVIISQRQSFNFWTGGTYELSKIIEAGSPLPNIELLQQIRPTRTLLAPWQSNLEPRLASVSPVTIVDSYPYSGDGNLWERLLIFTYRLGQLVGQQGEVNHLINQTDTHLDSLKERLRNDGTPLLFVQLWGERHVRVFGENSLPQAVSQRLGIDNAWHETTNQWGYSLVGIEALLGIDARLVIISSRHPTDFEGQLTQNSMWQHLPSVRRGDFIVLPGTFWFAGGLPSAQRFADALVEAIDEP